MSSLKWRERKRVRRLGAFLTPTYNATSLLNDVEKTRRSRSSHCTSLDIASCPFPKWPFLRLFLLEPKVRVEGSGFLTL